MNLKTFIPYAIIWAIWYLTYPSAKLETYNSATIQAVIFSIFVVVASLSLAYEKYRTSQHISESIHGSSFYRPVKAGDFNIRTYGDLQFLGIRGNDAIVVSDKNLDFQLGEQSVSLGSAVKVSFREYPREVQQKILDNNLRGKNYYLVIKPLFHTQNEKQLVINQNLFTDYNNSISEMRQILVHDYGSIENAVEHSGKLADRIDRRSWLQKLGFGGSNNNNQRDNND